MRRIEHPLYFFAEFTPHILGGDFMYNNVIYRIRTMDKTIITSVRLYCEDKSIPYRIVDDGMNPYTINFKTNKETFMYILSMNGLRIK